MPFPASRAQIEVEESKLGVRFPSGFASHLEKANGGEVVALRDTWQVHPVFDASDRKRAARTASHIARETAVAREWAGFPATAVSIASNGSGDRLVFLPAVDAAVLADAVHHWNHETREVRVVAESFSALKVVPQRGRRDT